MTPVMTIDELAGAVGMSVATEVPWSLRTLVRRPKPQAGKGGCGWARHARRGVEEVEPQDATRVRGRRGDGGGNAARHSTVDHHISRRNRSGGQIRHHEPADDRED